MASFARSLQRRRPMEPLSLTFETPAARQRRVQEERVWQDARALEAAGRVPEHERAAERLVAACPDDPRALVELARARLANARPVLAYQAIQTLFARWPDAPVSKSAAPLHEKVRRLVEGEGLGPEQMDAVAEHERIQILYERGDRSAARRQAERLLARCEYLPTMNNLSMLQWSDGEGERAVQTARRVLERDSDNVHALANLVRYLTLAGRRDEARGAAERLRAVPCPAPDAWTKKAEAFSVVGDDAAVLEVFEDAERQGVLAGEGLLHHFAAAASLRLGNEKRARALWRKALRLEPGLDVARENLADLERPVGERHAPWTHSVREWLPAPAQAKMARLIETAKDEEAARKAARKFLRRHRGLQASIEFLLERGDPNGRQLGFVLAECAETREMDRVLQAFALSVHGPDELRLAASQAAMRHGGMEAGAYRMWIRGRWEETKLWGCAIGDFPSVPHPKAVTALNRRAVECLKRGELDEADRLLEEALRMAPEAPDLLNHRAGVLGARGREAEALEVLRGIHRRNPQYVCAATSLARQAVREGKLDEARGFLAPLWRIKEMHFQEFGYMCMTQIAILSVEEKWDGVRSWMGMWREVCPDDPEMLRWGRMVG